MLAGMAMSRWRMAGMTAGRSCPTWKDNMAMGRVAADYCTRMRKRVQTAAYSMPPLPGEGGGSSAPLCDHPRPSALSNWPNIMAMLSLNDSVKGVSRCTDDCTVAALWIRHARAPVHPVSIGRLAAGSDLLNTRVPAHWRRAIRSWRAEDGH